MRKLIVVVAITGLSLVIAAPPVYAACSSSQVDACNNENNQCTNVCNIDGSPQSCYTACVCGYYECRESCGDGMVPEFCPNS
jgi:hypothetical protein